MEGTYTIIATFVGSDAYYGSQETTYVKVDPAPAHSPQFHHIQDIKVHQLKTLLIES